LSNLTIQEQNLRFQIKKILEIKRPSIKFKILYLIFKCKATRIKKLFGQRLRDIHGGPESSWKCKPNQMNVT
jgi:hypothetical protein